MPGGRMGAVGSRPAAASTPPSIASAVAVWWADDLAVSDGGNVTSWVDRIASTALTNPSTAPVMRSTGAPNSRPAVEFNGSSSYLRVASQLSTASQGVVVAVAKITTPANGNVVWASSDEASTTRYLLGGTHTPTSAEVEVQQRNNDTNDIVRGSTGVSAATWAVLEWSSSGTAYAHRLNDATQTMTASAGSNTGDWFGDTSARDNFTVGALRRTTVGSYNAMQVAFLLVADAELSSGDRSSLYGWINARYGL